MPAKLDQVMHVNYDKMRRKMQNLLEILSHSCPQFGGCTRCAAAKDPHRSSGGGCAEEAIQVSAPRRPRQVECELDTCGFRTASPMLAHSDPFDPPYLLQPPFRAVLATFPFKPETLCAMGSGPAPPHPAAASPRLQLTPRAQSLAPCQGVPGCGLGLTVLAPRGCHIYASVASTSQASYCLVQLCGIQDHKSSSSALSPS